MRESRTYGSVRGALSNERPYRDRCARNDGLSSAQDGLSQRLGRMRGEVANVFYVIASAAKQSILSYCGKMDCLAALAMTARVSRGSTHPASTEDKSES